MNFGQSPYIDPPFLWAPNVGINDVPTSMLGPGTTDPLRVFGLTNEERVVNIALLLGAAGTAWLLLKRR